MLTLDVGPKCAARTPAGFDDRPYELFGVRPVSPTIGAHIDGIDLREPLGDDLHAELHRALLEFKVLFFADQHIDDTHQRDFALRWGELEQHPFFSWVHPDQPDEPDVVRLDKGPASGGSENVWHADVTWRAEPSWGAVLRAVEVPELGGDTLWSDAAAAHDALPEELRDEIATLTAVHDWQHTFGMLMDDAERAAFAGDFPPVEHPVVRVHPETGRRTLFVNGIFTTRILGRTEAESDALLRRLTDEIARPEHQCRFTWRPGSVALWDNRATQHYAVSDYWPQRRVMERVSIAGDRPVGIDAAAPFPVPDD